MVIELTSRGLIKHKRMSLDWIDEYLYRRGITSETFIKEYENKTQNELADEYRIQKKDVGAILRTLGVDTLKARKLKIVESNGANLAEKQSKSQAKFAPFRAEILKHVSRFGWRDAHDYYDSDLVNELMKRERAVSPHSSKIIANKQLREIDNKWPQIESLVQKKRTIVNISKELELPLTTLYKVLNEKFPNYTGVRSQEEKLETALKISNTNVLNRRKSELSKREMLQSFNREYFVNYFSETIQTPHELALKLGVPSYLLVDRCRALDLDLSVFENKKFFNRFRYYAAKDITISNSSLIDSGIPEKFASFNIPVYALKHVKLFRLIYLSSQREFLQWLIEENAIASYAELATYFSIFHYQSYLEGTLYALNLAFPAYTELERFIIKSDRWHSKSSFDETLKVLMKNKLKIHEIAIAIDTPVKLTVSAILAIDPKYKNNSGYLSEPEEDFSKLLDSLSVDYKIRDRKALKNKQELDFLIEDKNVGFEVNPTHTHNSSYGYKRSPPKDPNYHLLKSKAGDKAGVKVIHLYDDFIKDKKKLNTFIDFTLKGATRVYASNEVEIIKCESLEEFKLARNFLRKNYRGRLTTLWRDQAYFFYKVKTTGELIGVAGFKESSEFDSDWELKRLCFSPGVQIEFSISKLLKYFKKAYPQCKQLITYTSIDYGYNNSYEKAGFKLIGETGPKLLWVNPRYPSDNYSAFISTAESAKSGVIAQRMSPRILTDAEAEKLVENRLPYRKGSGYGYARLYKAGAHTLIFSFDK